MVKPLHPFLITVGGLAAVVIASETTTIQRYMSNGFGEAQLIPDDATHHRFLETKAYMKGKPLECQNRERRCTQWATEGECEANPSYMQAECAAACFSCHLLDFSTRCPVTNEPNAWQPGAVTQLFERIIQDYNVTIVSQPDDTPKSKPWILVLDDFLNATECETLIRLGAAQGYEQSKDVGQQRYDGSYEGAVSRFRTSRNAWCDGDCLEHAVTQTFLARLESLTHLPPSHAEYLQLLEYQVGQRYHVHHDYVPHHVDRPAGPRILTVLVYLSDVEAGGATYFEDAGTVYPKRGRAVIWPNVLDSLAKDPRTSHEALPVEAGTKYAVNAWYHLRDFQSAHAMNCV